MKNREKENTHVQILVFVAESLFFIIWYFLLFSHILLPLHKPILPPSPPPSTRQVRRRVDLDLKAHDAFLVGREKNCDVVLEGLEMLGGRLKRRLLSSAWQIQEVFVYQI